MSRDETAAVLAILTEVYPKRIGSGDAAATVSAWHALLSDADGKMILAAAIAWSRANKPFPPTPGQLLETCKTQGETAEEAWGSVRKEIGRVGYTGEPNLSTLARRAIEAVGGPWEAMCRNLLAGEVVSLRARFLEAYRNIGERDDAVVAIGQAQDLLHIAAPIAAQYRIDDAAGSEGGREPGGDRPRIASNRGDGY